MDTLYLSLKKTCEDMIKSHQDTIFRYESGQDIPKELYDMAIEALPKWRQQLQEIEDKWPTD